MDSGEEPGHEWIDYFEASRNVSEFPKRIRWLVAHGYPDEQISKLVGGNALRALAGVWT